ncbi:cytochrome P450 2U1-like [Aplysia californica]|uniref:Cytochrome P450 2U1-like n=1 Tax=Aplysia californica TaxID=6500 RepID=A0ABM0JN88_APLCA|nr:cytochrome P450 2U1-like [Aplysia californica]
MGTNILVENIQEEASHFVRHLKSFRGQAVDLRVPVSMATANVMCEILLGRRYNYHDPEFAELIKTVLKFFKMLFTTSVVNYFPFLKYCPGDLFGAKFAKECTSGLVKTFAQHYALHEREKKPAGRDKSKDKDNNNNDNMIAALLQEKKRKVNNGEETFLDEGNIVRTITDLFIASTETTSSTLLWGILFLIRHPEVQENIYEELCREIGADTAVRLQDRNKLPYINAVIMETQRLANIVPLTMYTCAKSTEVGGYVIPSGASVLVSLDSVLMDTNLWGSDAKEFRPERFFNTEGKLCARKELIPFSIGRRSCIGEAFAKMELFLFLAILCQNFKFLPADSLPCQSPVFGLTQTPREFKVRVLSRNNASSE